MAAPKAPVLGGAKKEVSLDEAVFAAEVKPHIVHEAVRAELNAARQGTRAAKSRGMVSGGRAKPFRQKGTGRARQGTIRAPQFTGGGVTFPPTPRDFSVKVNKKALRAALRAALSDHAQAGTLGLVAGGRSKPWRQKGTGRARQGTIRAPQFAGGGVAFPPTPRDFSLKVNKKAARAALRAALSDHASAGTIGLVSGDSFKEPSTKQAVELLQGWGQTAPTVVVAGEDEEMLIKSFRNLPRVLVTVPAELEVAHVVWACSLVVSEAALPLVQGRAS